MVSIGELSRNPVVLSKRLDQFMTNDTRLKQAVLDKLHREPSVDAAHTGVTAHHGVVTLMCHVET